MRKLFVLGCKDTTRHFVRSLRGIAEISALITISPQKGKDQEVAGYDDLSDCSALVGDVYVANRYDLSSEIDVRYFTESAFDVGFVIGWQRLIPARILEAISIGAFGMHGSSRNLPYGRGRSPMNWSIIEGREFFFTNLFRYLPGADDGPIVDTNCFSIRTEDTAETLHYKNTIAMINMVRRNWDNIKKNQLSYSDQKSDDATYYPKRSPQDGQIDWSDDVVNIERLIRAVSKPFPGAFSYLGDLRVSLERASIFYSDLEAHDFMNIKPGTICDVFPNKKFLIRASGGVLIVHEYSAPKIEEIVAGNIFRIRQAEMKVFPRNKHGYFDLPSAD